MQKSIYLSEDAKTKEVLKRVDILQDSYGVSFSALVIAGLKMLVDTKRPAKKSDFRTAVWRPALHWRWVSLRQWVFRPMCLASG